MTEFQVPGREKSGKPLHHPMGPDDLTIELFEDVEEAVKKHIPQIVEDLEKLIGRGAKVHTIDIVLKIKTWGFEEESK